MGVVAAEHEDIRELCGELGGSFARKGRHPYLSDEVLARPTREAVGVLAVETRAVVVTVVEFLDELRNPVRAEFDDTDSQVRMALQGAVDDQIEERGLGPEF